MKKTSDGYVWENPTQLQDEAWDIVTKTFSYTPHSTFDEDQENWSAELMSKLLPR